MDIMRDKNTEGDYDGYTLHIGVLFNHEQKFSNGRVAIHGNQILCIKLVHFNAPRTSSIPRFDADPHLELPRDRTNGAFFTSMCVRSFLSNTDSAQPINRW